MSVRAILTDIEGTTTSISFVFDVLFPYAREHMAAFVRDHIDTPEVRRELEAVNREVNKTLTAEQAVEQLREWIDQDRKVTPLKALQGMIWKRGYTDGGFTGHVYDDALDHLRRWHRQGIKLYVYSSGSVAAQKLLFGHSDHGDLTPLFDGYFDTRVGMKRDSDSYRRIATEIGVAATDMLFLSDVVEELDAARDAGMQTAWLVRDNRTDTSGVQHPVCREFSDIEV
jgi:enolase-phosphatase E1